MDPIQQLSVVLSSVVGLADELDAISMRQPTPCAAFDVEAMLEHMIAGATERAAAFRGDPGTTPPAAFLPVTIRFRIAMRDLLDAIGSSGAMDRIVPTPCGDVTGDVAARVVAVEALVHGYDLATGSGLPFEPDDDLVSEVATFARTALGPDLREGDRFAAETVPPPTATPLQRLVAFSGRTVV